MVNRPLHHEEDMSAERQDVQQRPLGAYGPLVTLAAALLPAACYVAWLLGWMQ